MTRGNDQALAAFLAKADADVPFAYCQLTANYTLASSIAEQKLFDASANGALSLAVGRYRFDCLIYITDMSATSGNGTVSLNGAGTAVLANVMMMTAGKDSNTPLTTGVMTTTMSVTEDTPNPMVTAGVGVGVSMRLSGVFNVTTAGTIIPSISLQTAAAAVVQAGSYFECIRIGDSNTLGMWS